MRKDGRIPFSHGFSLAHRQPVPTFLYSRCRYLRWWFRRYLRQAMIICQIIPSQDSNNGTSESRFYPGRQTGSPRAQQVPSPRYRIESVQTWPCSKHEKPLTIGFRVRSCLLVPILLISSPILQQPHHHYPHPGAPDRDLCKKIIVCQGIDHTFAKQSQDKSNDHDESTTSSVLRR